MLVNDVYEKYCNGDKISDAQLLEAIIAYRDAASSVLKLGIAFRVTFKEIDNVYMRLNDMAIARGLTH